MTRMTGPDCVVRCNLINKYIHTYIHNIHTYIHTYIHNTYIHTYRGKHKVLRAQVRIVKVETVCPLCRV